MNDILESVKQALSHRDSRRHALAEKIRSIAEGALGAARCSRLDLGEAGVLEWRSPVGDCSQWANRMDYPGHRGERHLALVVGGGDVRSLGEVTVGFFADGNFQRLRGPTTDERTGSRVRPATVAQLRAVAATLPEVLARLLAEARSLGEEEARAADSALSALQ